MQSKEQAIESIKLLIDQFESGLLSYKSAEFNEYNTRTGFINPFFQALNWDIYNKQNLAESYREVIQEDKIKIGKSIKVPDYCFTVYGQRKFYVEAKKPIVNVKEDIQATLQARIYGWNARLPISIVTDFEEFAVYDCSIKPNANDNSTIARIKYLTFRDYLNEFDFLWNTFSKEKVLKGSFDNFVKSDKNRKGSSTVDKEFLKSIENWRKLISQNIALNNKKFNEDEINYTVQQTLDRIIFLRICEDREIEPYNTLKDIIKHKKIYSLLFEYFQKADQKYNSGLFNFKKDQLSSNLKIDDDVLHSIIDDLYYPKSPYEFSVIPVEILGQAYEQFLGKVIRLTDSHRVKIDEKPEVRKAGGVYYTPQYIVDYIVKETVGKLIENKTPQEISKIKIVDPACGSGSFLLGAYKYLLEYHYDFYLKNSDKIKSKEDNPLTPDKQLTTKEKKRILLNNIYGVDIDPQAIEVTKLSLLLKTLEGETQASIQNQLLLFHDRVLPSLESNIKCGNSLIDNTIKTINPDLPFQELKELNAFNWSIEYKDIFQNGGFNCVIGNPPYLRIQGLQEHHPEQVEFYLKNYISAVKRFDFYLLFLEKGFRLLKEGGLLGFICPHKFINSDFGSGLRKFLLDNTALKRIINFGNNLIFENATTYTGIFILEKLKQNGFEYYEFKNTKTNNIKEYLLNTDSDYSKYRFNTLTEAPWIFSDNKTSNILNKLSRLKTKLGDIFEYISQGIVSTGDDIFYLKGEFVKNIFVGFSERLNQEIKIESGIMKPILKGEDVKKYTKSVISYYTIYPHYLREDKTLPIEEIEFKDKYPLAYEYLKNFKKELTEKKIKYKTNPKYWYTMHRSREIQLFESSRIITPEISLGCNMTLCDAGIYNNTKVYNLVPKKDYKEDILYWLGIMNSKVLWWFISNTGYVLRGGYYTFKTNYLVPFPVPTINFNKPEEIKIHDQIVQLVSELLGMHNELNINKIQFEKDKLLRYIKDFEAEIDELVFKLYGLTSEEIKIIEENN